MKKQLLFVILVMTILAGYGQEIRVEKGSDNNSDYPEIRGVLVESPKEFFFAGEDDKNTYAIFAGGGVLKNMIFIAHDKSSGKQVYSKAIKINYTQKALVSIFQVTFTKGKFHVLYSQETAKNACGIFVADVSSQDMTPVNPRMVFECKGKKWDTFYKLILAKSFDNSKSVLYAKEYNEAGNEDGQHCEFVTFDEDMNVIYTSNFVAKEPDHDTWIVNGMVSPAGDVCLILNCSKKSASTYKYVYFNSDSKEFKEEFVQVYAGFPIAVRSGFDKNSNLLITGYYSASDPTEQSHHFAKDLAGVFIKKTDRKTQALVTNEKYEVGETVVPIQGKPDRISSMQQPEPLVIGDDGGIYMLYQQSTSGTDIVIKYHVLVSRFDPNGTLAWNRVIAKTQYLGHNMITMAAQKKLYVMFNDHADNIHNNDPAQTNELKSPKHGAFVVVSLDETGLSKKEVLHQYKNDPYNYFIQPENKGESMPFKNGVNVFHENGSKYRIMRLTAN